MTKKRLSFESGKRCNLGPCGGRVPSIIDALNNPDYYEVYNKKEECLGEIKFYKKWNKWVWEQHSGVVMSKNCLKEIIEKLEQLKKER